MDRANNKICVNLCQIEDHAFSVAIIRKNTKQEKTLNENRKYSFIMHRK